MKRAGVEHDNSRDAFGMPHRPGHADHSAPIVQHQRDVAAHVQAAEQGSQVVDPASQGEIIMRRVGLVGQSAADVIGHDAAEAVAQCGNQIAIVKRPGGIAMKHDDGVALALVEIVQAQAVEIQEMAGERVERPVEVHNRAYQ